MQESMQSTYNYLVPADGTTHEVSYSGTLVSGQPYTVDWHSFVQNNFPFRPQGAKIQNPSSDNVTIENLQTGETSTCPPNSSRWVTFTSTSHMQQQISGSGQVSIIFVDYPVIETAPVSLVDGTPTTASNRSVTILQGGDDLSAANPLPTQLSQGDAVLSASNPVPAQLSQGGAALSATNPLFAQITNDQLVIAPNAATLLSGSVSASGSTTIGTPTADSNLRLLELSITGNAAMATAGLNSLSALVNGTTVFSEQVYLPETSGSGALLYQRSLNFSEASFSAGASGTFEVSLGTALASGSVNVNGYFA